MNANVMTDWNGSKAALTGRSWPIAPIEARFPMLFTKGRAALVEVAQRAAYEVRLEAAARACR